MPSKHVEALIDSALTTFLEELDKIISHNDLAPSEIGDYLLHNYGSDFEECWENWVMDND